MSYNNRVQQPCGVPVYNKKTGKKVAVVSYEYGEERNPVTTGGEGKKLRLFIDDKEVDLTPPRKEELTLVAEKKQMMASMTQPVKPKSNRFACLDDSESDDDTDTIVTPKKSWQHWQHRVLQRSCLYLHAFPHAKWLCPRNWTSSNEHPRSSL